MPETANPSIGAHILYRYPGIPFYKPAQLLNAQIIDTRLTKQGEIELKVKADGINLPKWIDREQVASYLWNQNAPAFASAL